MFCRAFLWPKENLAHETKATLNQFRQRFRHKLATLPDELWSRKVWSQFGKSQCDQFVYVGIGYVFLAWFFLYFGHKKARSVWVIRPMGFISDIKKALHFHVRLIVFGFIVTAVQSIYRLLERARRLYDQGVDENLLQQYVQRWLSWLHSGLRGRVSHDGGFNRIWLYVLNYLNSGNKTSPG